MVHFIIIFHFFFFFCVVNIIIGRITYSGTYKKLYDFSRAIGKNGPTGSTPVSCIQYEFRRRCYREVKVVPTFFGHMSLTERILSFFSF